VEFDREKLVEQIKKYAEMIEGRIEKYEYPVSYQQSL
jgi:hypothetical protein